MEKLWRKHIVFHCGDLNIPEEVYESATLGGASRAITVPMIAPNLTR